MHLLLLLGTLFLSVIFQSMSCKTCFCHVPKSLFTSTIAIVVPFVLFRYGGWYILFGREEAEKLREFERNWQEHLAEVAHPKK